MNHIKKGVSRVGAPFFVPAFFSHGLQTYVFM